MPTEVMKLKSLQNTCVFTLRLHLGNVDNAKTNLAKSFFFCICHCDTSERVYGPSVGVVLEHIWAAKNSSRIEVEAILKAKEGMRNVRVADTGSKGDLFVELKMKAVL